jgi:hypothetical protein
MITLRAISTWIDRLLTTTLYNRLNERASLKSDIILT